MSVPTSQRPPKIEDVVANWTQRSEQDEFRQTFLGSPLPHGVFFTLIPEGFQHFQGQRFSTLSVDFVSIFKCDKTKTVLSYWGSFDLDEGDEPLRIDHYTSNAAYLAGLMDVCQELNIEFLMESVSPNNLNADAIEQAKYLHESEALK